MNDVDERTTRVRRLASRTLGIVFGVATQVAFAVTVWFLFFFLKRGVAPDNHNWLLLDTALALQFAVVHSVLLHPHTKRLLSRYVKAEFYGLFFCLATCLGLTAIFVAWSGSAGVVWQLEGWAARVVDVCFYASWLALFYSLYLSGLGYQTGLTPWWYWVRRQRMPRREFVPRSLYRWFRHPIYLSFLGLIWFTTRMSWDHALLTCVWTVYIFVGSYLKDERLAFYLGEGYRRYQAAVPGYPLMLWGPLAKRPLEVLTNRQDAERTERVRRAA